MGARCFQNGHFGRISSTLYSTVFRSFGGHASARRVSLEPCFRQAHCFVQGPLRFLPVPPNPTCARSHFWGFPIKHDCPVHGLRSAWPPLQILAVKKYILLCNFWAVIEFEKSAGKIFLSGKGGLELFGDVSDRFSDPVLRFSCPFPYQINFLIGASWF